MEALMTCRGSDDLEAIRIATIQAAIRQGLDTKSVITTFIQSTCPMAFSTAGVTQEEHDNRIKALRIAGYLDHKVPKAHD